MAVAKLKPIPLSIMACCWAIGAQAAPIDSEVVVIATRVGQSGFDLPMSIDRIDQRSIRAGRAQNNLSESLPLVPGVVAQNRQNYAQDLQISVRGFGSRSTFGVRGVRLYADGIPASMPDGQGQVSHFDIGSAQRIEILRGPFSALYGNSSGGVIALFTEDGKPGAALQAGIGYGSFNTRRAALKASGEQDGVNYVVSAADLRTDGYRDHSAARRVNFNSKVRFALDDVSQLTVLVNWLDLPDVQDPLGLTRAQFDENPEQAGSNADAFDTRKSVRQEQLGLHYQRQLNADHSLSAMVYRGHRDTVQYQAIPTASQSSPAHAGGVIDLDRDYWGADLNWTGRYSLLDRPLQITLGASYDDLDEARRGYQNFIGGTVGVRGALRRDEGNTIYNVDEYLQVQWEPGRRWLLAAGVRNSEIRLRSRDHYIVTGNGDDSGSRRYSATTPVLGATFRATEKLNVYLTYGEGFETPTFNELAYRSTSGAVTGLNLGLSPSRSEHIELGMKARLSPALKLNIAAFHADTEDELAVQANAGGRSVFQNVGRTRRKGVEVNLDGHWDNGLGVALAYTWLRAVYEEDFSACTGLPCTPTVIPSGNYLPGVPASALYAELSWQHVRSGFSTALEVRNQARVYVNDTNSDAAERYTVVNARAGFEQQIGAWKLQEFVRVDNIGDREYAGSVIVNESNARYFEPAPGRNGYVGVSAAYSW